MRIRNRFLLNFGASYCDGGYKRLHAYARWFDSNGGAWFLIHPRCAQLREEFPRNGYFTVYRRRLARLFDDYRYLSGITAQIGPAELYYSYGIPLYTRIAEVNWFHLSNVLPLRTRGIPVSAFDRLKFAVLGRRIRRGFALADVISAESRHSLSLIDVSGNPRTCVSVNGSDEELESMRTARAAEREDIATVLGTYRYKDVDSSWRIFRMLKAQHPTLKLAIIGEPAFVPGRVRADPDVLLCGPLARPDVVAWLRRSRFYISCTHTENSYNAASEAIFLADESYISDIGPHRELLEDSRCYRLSLPGVRMPVLHVKSAGLSSAKLRTWDCVIEQMIELSQQSLQHSRATRAVPWRSSGTHGAVIDPDRTLTS
jgi:hypothetical protein